MIPEIRFRPLRLDALQTAKMVHPILILMTRNVRVAELEHDVAKILGERLPGEAFHILKNKHLRLSFPDHASRLRKEIPPIGHRPMLAADREGLARRTAGDEIDPAFPAGEVLAMHISFDQRPVPYEFAPSPLVGPDGLASIVIEFQHGIMAKAGV